MFFPGILEIILVLVISIIFFSPKDWLALYCNYKKFISFLSNIYQQNKDQIIKNLSDIKKDSEVYSIQDVKEDFIIVNNKKYLTGQDGNLYQVFDLDSKNESRNIRK